MRALERDRPKAVNESELNDPILASRQSYWERNTLRGLCWRFLHHPDTRWRRLYRFPRRCWRILFNPPDQF